MGALPSLGGAPCPATTCTPKFAFWLPPAASSPSSLPAPAWAMVVLTRGQVAGTSPMWPCMPHRVRCGRWGAHHPQAQQGTSRNSVCVAHSAPSWLSLHWGALPDYEKGPYLCLRACHRATEPLDNWDSKLRFFEEKKLFHDKRE